MFKDKKIDLALSGGVALGAAHVGVLKALKELGNIIAERLSKSNIEDADIPLAVVATDIASGEKVIFYSGDVATVVTASTSIPGIYIPVEQGDRMLVDGGLSEFVPISPLKEMGAEKIIAVVTGISFLGAGTIIRGEGGVEGLTTAASLLFSAVIGMGVALSQYILAVGATILAIIILFTLARIEHWIKRRTGFFKRDE